MDCEKKKNELMTLTTTRFAATAISRCGRVRGSFEDVRHVEASKVKLTCEKEAEREALGWSDE